MSLMSQLVKPFVADQGYFLQGIGPRPIEASDVSIATTLNTDVMVVAPYDGALIEAVYSGTTVLAANDTNFVTFSITNLGQAGAGAVAMLTVGVPNTTQLTGGSGLVAGGFRQLQLIVTTANLEVKKNDTLRVRFAVTGTLGAAIADPVVQLRFVP